ncbi:MAG: hypothetical protein P1U88_03195 [Thalassobaculaceae bacterium]|nr:hypothetical protein [Thalassobaculaceae bacterium]
MSSPLITLVLAVSLSAIAIVATPLAARVTHRLPNPEAGYFSTTIMALLITAAYGIGAISAIIWISEFGSTAAWILIPAYLVTMLIVGRVAWKILGPHQATVLPAAGIRPLGA